MYKIEPNCDRRWPKVNGNIIKRIQAVTYMLIDSLSREMVVSILALLLLVCVSEK